MPNCINRNIVECKARNGVRIQKKYVVLIETSWNVKNGRSAEENNGKPVLIETSWNVKIGMTRQVGDGVNVLIETSWNVKYHSRPAHDRRRTY